MLKKKTIYIVGIILFSLILIIDVSIYLIAPNNTVSFNGSELDDILQGGYQMPEGFDQSQIPSMGELPEGFDQSQIPNMGELPEGFDQSQIPSTGELPEGFDQFDVSALIQTPQEQGLLAAVRSTFLPILIIGIAGNAVCAVMLVVISKKNKVAEEEPEEAAHINYGLPL